MNVQDRSAFKAGDYRSEITPVWCPGCGDYAVLKTVTQVLANIGASREDTVFVSEKP